MVIFSFKNLKLVAFTLKETKKIPNFLNQKVTKFVQENHNVMWLGYQTNFVVFSSKIS
jgi:hypothetical protein